MGIYIFKNVFTGNNITEEMNVLFIATVDLNDCFFYIHHTLKLTEI